MKSCPAFMGSSSSLNLTRGGSEVHGAYAGSAVAQIGARVKTGRRSGWGGWRRVAWAGALLAVISAEYTARSELDLGLRLMWCA
jgi:hypothetical protein